MEVVLKPALDWEFAESLTKENMAEYYQRYDISWDTEMFADSWKNLDNFEVHVDGQRVGVIRFSYTVKTTHLRDFQLVKSAKGMGIGTICLTLVKKHAIQHHSVEVVLRVFPENPAVGLYKRAGFLESDTCGNVIEMRCSL